MSKDVEHRRINFREADFRSKDKIIKLYDKNWKYRDVTPDTADFAQFLDDRIQGNAGTRTIYTDCGLHRVRMHTDFYVAYEASSMARPGSFLGFCAIQHKFELTLYPRYEKPPFEFEIPWFLIAETTNWSVADIADAMLRALLAERACPPYVSAVWAYDFGVRPQGAWWPACLERAGFVPVEKDLQRYEPEDYHDYTVTGYKLSL